MTDRELDLHKTLVDLQLKRYKIKENMISRIREEIRRKLYDDFPNELEDVYLDGTAFIVRYSRNCEDVYNDFFALDCFRAEDVHQTRLKTDLHESIFEVQHIIRDIDETIEAVKKDIRNYFKY